MRLSHLPIADGGQHSLPIEYSHVLEALGDTLALDQSQDLIGPRLTSGQSLSSLASYGFLQLFPEVLAVVAIERSILRPKDS
jgi:hypothetical protein